MDYHQFIAEASRISSGEPLDKTIRLRADLDGSIEVVCGYFSPDQIPTDSEGNPTKYILSATAITVEEFYGFVHGHLERSRELEIQWRIKEMIAGVGARLEELTGHARYTTALSNVFTILGASEYWGLNQETVKKWVQRKRFHPNEVKKSGGIWLVTRGGMVRLTGRFGGGLHIVYKATNKMTREVYVGCTDRTLDAEKAWLEKNLENLPEKLQNGLKHGLTHFEWEVLEHVQSKGEAEDRQRYWIKQLKSDVNGYN